MDTSLLTETWGFTVTKIPEPINRKVTTAYHIDTPRGAKYSLWRCLDNPSVLAVMSRSRFNVAKCHGYSHFIERDGRLVPLR